MGELTDILSSIQHGDRAAVDLLLPIIYGELKKIAAQRISLEKPGQTIQATDLVHEAFLRLFKPNQLQDWESRGHFFSSAAEAMRRILIEQARRRLAAKRGGQLERKEFHESQIIGSIPDEEVLQLNDALDELQLVDEVAANLVRLRYFGGLNMTEISASLGISVRSAQDIWSYARSWLHHKIKES